MSEAGSFQSVMFSRVWVAVQDWYNDALLDLALITVYLKKKKKKLASLLHAHNSRCPLELKRGEVWRLKSWYKNEYPNYSFSETDM